MNGRLWIAAMGSVFGGSNKETTEGDLSQATSFAKTLISSIA